MAFERLRGEARDLVELVLVPGAAALMPWRIGYRLLRHASRWDWLYREETQAALAQASARGWAPDPQYWARIRRLVALVDHADYYLARTRSDKWLARHVDVQGDWPAPGKAGVLCTFHWGAGMWALRHASAHGLRPHALVSLPREVHFAGRTVFRKYSQARARNVVATLGRVALETSVSLRPMMRALERGDQVIAAIDVPADQVSASQDMNILGVVARVPRGLMRLAIDHRLPVTVFVTGFDLASGRRFVRIHRMGVRSDRQELMREVFDVLDSAIRENPPAWHFWSESERFFVS